MWTSPDLTAKQRDEVRQIVRHTASALNLEAKRIHVSSGRGHKPVLIARRVIAYLLYHVVGLTWTQASCVMGYGSHVAASRSSKEAEARHKRVIDRVLDSIVEQRKSA